MRQLRDGTKRPAELGDNDAMYNLGVMYAEGNGVLQSYETAFGWYEKSSELGDREAMKILRRLDKFVSTK